MLELHLQGTQHQPRRGHGRLLASHHFQFVHRIAQALRLDQSSGIGQAHSGFCLRRGQEGLDDGLGLGCPGHEVECGQHRTDGRGVLRVRPTYQRERARGVAGPQPGTAERHTSGHACGLGLQVGLQHGLQHGGHRLGVGGLLEEARNGGDQPAALTFRAAGEQEPQRFGGVARPVQRAQNLQLQPHGLQRIGHGLPPGPHRRQRPVTCPGLQRDVGCSAEHLFLTRAPRRVHQHLEGHGRLALAQFDLADQQLVEQQRVECGARGCCRGLLTSLRNFGRARWCWRLGLC